MNPNETKRAAAERYASETSARCAGETCPRPAEPGEIYCAECGLERSLYFRESRFERSRETPIRRG